MQELLFTLISNHCMHQVYVSILIHIDKFI